MKRAVILSFISLIFISLVVSSLVLAGDDSGNGNSGSLDRSNNKDNFGSRSISGINENIKTKTNSERDKIEKKEGVRENIEKEIKEKAEKKVREVVKEVGGKIKKGEEIFRARIKEKIENEEERKEIIKGFRSILKEKEGELMIDERRIIKVKELDEEGKNKEISVGKIKIKTNLDLASEMDEQTKGERLRAILSNGKVANVRIMPDRASLIALKKLRVKCEEVNCNVELKEVREGDKLKLKYKIATKKDGRLLFLFKLRMDVDSEVDAETGEVVAKKPWWAFLVDEDDATDEDIKENVEGDEIDENVDVEGDVAPNVELDAKISELVSSVQGIENNIKLILEVAKRDDKTNIRADIEGQLTDEQKKIWEEIQNLAKLSVENVKRDIKLKIVIRNNVEEEKEKERREEKVIICHIPRGEPSTAKTIRVGAPALKAHLAHGDYEGECVGERSDGNETIPKNETPLGNETIPGNVTMPGNETLPPEQNETVGNESNITITQPNNQSVNVSV